MSYIFNILHGATKLGRLYIYIGVIKLRSEHIFYNDINHAMKTPYNYRKTATFLIGKDISVDMMSNSNVFVELQLTNIEKVS